MLGGREVSVYRPGHPGKENPTIVPKTQKTEENTNIKENMQHIEDPQWARTYHTWHPGSKSGV